MNERPDSYWYDSGFRENNILYWVNEPFYGDFGNEETQEKYFTGDTLTQKEFKIRDMKLSGTH